MRFLIAAWYEFLKNIRDIKMIAIMVLFPIIVTYLIGTAVQGFFTAGDGASINVACVNLDRGAVGPAFNQFLDTKEIKERLNVTRFPTLERGQKALEDGSCTALVYLPENLTYDLLKGEKHSILLYGTKDLELVEALAKGFVSSFNANFAVSETGGQAVQLERKSAVTTVNRTKNGITPSMTDYYAVLILLQVLVVGAIFGSYITTQNYGSDLHIRVHALPMNRWALLYGRIVGSVAYLLVSALAVVLFTKVAYGVNWNGNIAVMLGTVTLFCFIMVGIGVISGRVFKKFSTSLMVVFVLMFFFGIVSGSVSPRTGAVALGAFTPNYYAKILMFGSIYGYTKQIMIQSALWLGGIAVAVYAALTALMRRVGYDNI